MDLPTFIRNNFERINSLKEEFKTTKEQPKKQKIVEEFINCLTNLHKVMKGGGLSQTAIDKFKLKITAEAKEAEPMKAELSSSSPTTSQNMPHQNSNQKPEHQKSTGNTDEDKDKKAFEEALKGAIITEKPNVKWEDVAGLENAKQTLKEAIVFPNKFPQIFVGLRKPWKGILLYGVS